MNVLCVYARDEIVSELCFHRDQSICGFPKSKSSGIWGSKRFHAGARPVICFGSRMPMAPNAWRSMSWALRDNLRGSYFDHSVSNQTLNILKYIKHMDGYANSLDSKPWGSSVVWNSSCQVAWWKHCVCRRWDPVSSDIFLDQLC